MEQSYYAEMLAHFKKVHFVIESVLPKHCVYFSYNAQSKLEGLEFTLWSDDTSIDDPIDEKMMSLQETVVFMNERHEVGFNLDELSDYMVISAVFQNQMDKILPHYNHTGWEINEIGIKETEALGGLLWEEVEKQLNRPEVIVFSIAELEYI